MRSFNKTSCLQYLGIFLLVPLSKSATNGRDGIAVNPFFYNHTDLDFVQCNHSFYKIQPYNGRAEIESSQESRNEKTDTLSPAAANVPSNALPLPSPSKTNNKKHSDEDDEDNLERLCNDAFHSFLCKPIKGPRKTPNGRLRQNAVLPPDILAGFSSNQDIARVRLNNKEPPQSAFNNIGYSFAKPTTTTVPSSPQPNPANQFPQRFTFP
ncbi:uncharacterized protein LOC124373332 [Homalodisca vitripennis]|uniref:uncharacterized protein LOC124373332 n=1 Tax=Homalodisca vitripennis TaxID=197043 RepID=UPI001EEA7C2E|nr:uncharacterized protein LOC124373332 [Homalodisca vitripennis]